MEAYLHSDFVNSDFFVLKPFNLMFFIMIAITAAFAYFYIKAYKDRPRKQKRYIVANTYVIVLVLFFLYKVGLWADPDYSVILAENNQGGFTWLKELPLQLCNINIILIIVAMLTDSRPLTAFVFFASFIGALFPFLTPAVGFSGYSILLPRMLGYYITHQFVIIEMPILAGLNLFRPKFEDIKPTSITILLVAACVFCINVLLRVTGLEPNANYFYSFGPDGNPILAALKSLIPIPGLYVLPLYFVLLGYMLIVTWIFGKAEKRVAKRKAKKTKDGEDKNMGNLDVNNIVQKETADVKAAIDRIGREVTEAEVKAEAEAAIAEAIAKAEAKAAIAESVAKAKTEIDADDAELRR